MRLSLFDFHLPPERIAQHAVEPRDSAKLLVVKDALEIKTVTDLPAFLQAGDVLVFNNSKVIPARLRSGNIEIFLHKPLGDSRWQVFAKPAKKLAIGSTIPFQDNVTAQVIEKLPSGEVILKFSLTKNEFRNFLEQHGEVPLPPYITRDGKPSDNDKTRYQTVYAKPEGSVAAPTAGLHFTEALLERIKDKGVRTAFVTLHVGAGTFQPVKVEDTKEHIMHSEWGEISAETANIINIAKRVICVGTTSLRLLESAADETGKISEWQGDTDIFITPGYTFKRADMLMTNFHLPKSTLFMLVSAFSGLEQMQAAYQFAIERRLRFYSYGDACLLYRHV